MLLPLLSLEKPGTLLILSQPFQGNTHESSQGGHAPEGTWPVLPRTRRGRVFAVRPGRVEGLVRVVLLSPQGHCFSW